jgi:small subunit ribosomal protein S7
MTEKLLLFNRWDLTDVKVDDPGLRRHINLNPIVIPRSGGRHAPKPFQKEKISIVERLMNKLMVSGHRGKKHKLSSGHQVGDTQGLYKTIKNAFEIIEKRTKKNPVQVLVQAIENSALLEEIASYRLGGIIARSSVVVSPQRRIDIALRHISQGIQKVSFKNKKSLAEVISDELIAASNNDSKSYAVQERNRIEREAEGAR